MNEPIALHEFRPGFGMPTLSPFGLKLEAFLRLAKIPYRRVYRGNPRTGPKGKIPYIVDGGVKMGDSQLIVEHLSRTRGIDVDAHLSEGERARGHAIRRFVEEGLYFVNVHQRFVDDGGYRVVGPLFLGFLPSPLRLLAGPVVRRDVARHLRSQGIGRHTPDEVVRIGENDVRALAGLLGEQPFFLGARPSTVDACVYGITHGMHCIPLPSPVAQLIKATPSLAAFDRRMTELIFAGERF